MKLCILKTVSTFDGCNFTICIPPVPDGQRHTREDEVRGIAWNIWGPRFINVAEVHGSGFLTLGKKERLGF